MEKYNEYVKTFLFGLHWDIITQNNEVLTNKSMKN